MTEEQANKIYDILVEECRASDHPDQRRAFVHHLTEYLVPENPASSMCFEYRFCGALGFGGKFWVNSGRLYVSCYSEDESPARKAMIARANQRLMPLYAKRCTTCGHPITAGVEDPRTECENCLHPIS